MNFIFDRDSMLREMAIAQEIIANKNVNSILSNVLLTAENNTLTIKATDIRVNFETRIPVDVHSEGMTTLFCDKFVALLNTLDSGDVEFNLEDTIVTIKAGNNKFQLKCISSDKFPEFASAENVPYFEVPALDFREMINQTIFAVGQDENRIFTNGVYIEKLEDKVVMVSTDGKRLSYIEKSLGGIPDFPSAIVPPKIFNVLLKRMPLEGNISIAIVDKVIFFQFGTYKFTSVLIDGQFPNYHRVIPESQSKRFTVNKADLSSALKKVKIFVEHKSNRVYFKAQPGVLIIRSQESEFGDAKVEIPCRYDGDEIEMAFNYVYIEDPIRVMESDELTFEFTEDMKPVTFRTEPAKDFFHIVMPMQKEN